MDLQVLGNVGIHGGGGFLTLERAGERCVLASLALNPGRLVRVDTLVEQVWGNDPPAKAEETVAGYVRAVRRVVTRAGGDREWLVNRRPRAYLLRIDDSRVDYHRFAKSMAEARRAARAGEHDQAVLAYGRALDQWRGDPLTDVVGDWADRCREALLRERLDAWCALFEQQIMVGDYESVAGRAEQLINEVVPTDRLIALALYGLARGGQRAAIPQFMKRAEKRMRDSVDIGPGAGTVALARRLIDEADAGGIAYDLAGEDRRNPFFVPSAEPMQREDSGDAESSDTGASTRGVSRTEMNSPGGGIPGAASGVTMAATAGGNVYQTAGDQYIVES